MTAQSITASRKRRPRSRLTEDQKSAITILAESNPALTHNDIATLQNVERSTVSKILADANIVKSEVDDYKSNEGTVIANLRKRIYNSITDEDLKKTPFGSRIMAYGILFDKNQLIDGKATDHVVQLNLVAADLRGIKPRDK